MVAGQACRLRALRDVALVQVEQLPDFSLRYMVTLPSGDHVELGSGDVLHLRGLSWNNFSGINIVNAAREAIGLAIATESSQAYLHGNGGRPSGVLTTPNTVGPEAVAKIAEHLG